MIETIISAIIFIITIFFAGFNSGKKSIKDQSDKERLNEMEKIHKDSVARSNDDRNIRIDRLRKYTKN